MHENQSVYIIAGQWHRLDNPGKTPLELIEVQLGSYLGEDDIVRADDVYNRSARRNEIAPLSVSAWFRLRRRILGSRGLSEYRCSSAPAVCSKQVRRACARSAGS